ncbi:hypothetical protein [Natrinema salifodinae]|uniref:Uncharacterized protein n=1 Tax=Natrinema salifodinae TaxID=1202768 RepID=A0A1I0PDZ1_9EURY|nr:hypothetical protein [Natrinema salifodinae]SEW11820.1 hypothetical protein SAMN05216285_2396 [Natrinema salifodinae]
MPLIVEGNDERTDRNEVEPIDYREFEATDRDRPGQQRIDVTDLHAAGIEEFVRTTVGTDAVSLEHRGARTYLLLEE